MLMGRSRWDRFEFRRVDEQIAVAIGKEASLDEGEGLVDVERVGLAVFVYELDRLAGIAEGALDEEGGVLQRGVLDLGHGTSRLVSMKHPMKASMRSRRTSS